MNGIVFFQTKMLPSLKKFYLEKVGCRLWMNQGDCLIFKHGDFLFGFCQREEADCSGVITFFFKTKKTVNKRYLQFSEIADKAPRRNLHYPIYHFFARDPEGRKIEFQYFYNLRSEYPKS